jgi:hypothetical protein
VTVDVTAKYKGSYCNNLPPGALKTSNGSNVASAVATLTVKTPIYVAPSLSKAFSPTTIKAGGVSTVTITLKNTDSTVANLTARLDDYLPSNMVIAQKPNGSTTCSGTLTARAGGMRGSLTGGSIPANGSCTVTMDVTVKYRGSYINTLPSGALQTSHGYNADPAVATLTVKVK